MPRADVLIIGAGPAGINAAYALERAGIEYRIIERTYKLAPTWSSLYPSLRLNTSRFYSHLPGRKFPLSWGIFPTAAQYHQHLVSWVAEQNFDIEYGIEVDRVAPRDDGLWQVESSEGSDAYHAVIPATGVFDNPILPEIDGMARFQGEILHSRDFRHPDQARGKRTMVVGNGPSGTDIAVAAGPEAAEGSVYLAIRTGVDLRPRYPYGVPRHAWMMLGETLPAPLCVWLQSRTGAIKYNLEDFGVWESPPNTGSAVGYRGPELLNALREGQVQPVRHPIRFDAKGAELADGRYLELDAVIMATGFFPVLHQYLDIEMQFSRETYYPETGCDWDIGPNGVRGWPLRDVSEHPNGRQIAGYPGLYLVGVFYKGRGAFYNMGAEAAIAAGQIERQLSQRLYSAAAV
ncbi:MAG: NAD(P)/FAD-dependent oxidoreductase [Chloroflexota bacterium]|nr:NAD(P)/FAD-dependent oxidoreductase [Chloroflexota bacterium]